MAVKMPTWFSLLKALSIVAASFLAVSDGADGKDPGEGAKAAGDIGVIGASFYSFHMRVNSWRVKFKDAVAQEKGAIDWSLALQIQRAHREWEPTHLLPRPANTFALFDETIGAVKGWMEIVMPQTGRRFLGLRLELYGAVGETRSNLIWGVTPPYWSNRFTGKDSPFSFHSLWFRDNETNLLATLGVFRPLYISDALFKGQPNPTLWGKPFLPLFGVHIGLRLYNPTAPFYRPFRLQEWFFGTIGDASPYTTLVGGGVMEWHHRRALYGIGVLHVQNFREMMGLVAAPIQGEVKGVPVTWATPNGRVGKQRQMAISLWGNWRLPRQSKVWGVIAHSWYRPGNDASGAQGTLLSLGGVTKLFRGDLAVEVLSVDSDYDPFVLPFPRPPGFSEPAFFHDIPFPTRYPNHYFLHDSRKYPHNRWGILVQWDKPFVKPRSFGVLSLSFSHLRQKEASTVANLIRPGFIEPLFGIRTVTGTDAKGWVTSYGFALNYELPKNRRFSVAFHEYRFGRATTDANRFDTKIRFGLVRYSHPLHYTLSTKLYFDIGYAIVLGKGAWLSDRANLDFFQHGPFLRWRYRFTRSPDILRSLAVTVRWLWQSDRARPKALGSWRAFQWGIEGRWDL